MLFASKQEFKDAIKDYAMGKGFTIRLVKDDHIRVRVNCKHKCPFVIKAWTLGKLGHIMMSIYVGGSLGINKHHPSG